MTPYWQSSRPDVQYSDDTGVPLFYEQCEAGVNIKAMDESVVRMITGGVLSFQGDRSSLVGTVRRTVAPPALLELNSAIRQVSQLPVNSFATSSSVFCVS